jgi:FtsP/CotA-like multicopper oxidase with cupredoxin domain
MRHAAVVALACSALGCGAAEPDRAPIEQPPGWADELRVAEASDWNADPNITEIDLHARIEPLELIAGTTTPAWTYNGTLPGPLIRAKQGDRVIVHFTSDLPEETTIHWHGLRIPAEMDGMPGHSQPPIPPGGSFTYDFVVPDASTFWYHPHLNSTVQVGNGLYAPFIVDESVPLEGVGDELVLVLSDISLRDDGSFFPPEAGGELSKLFGREGSILLVNGKRNPTLRARPGLRQRWRVINASRSRYFQLQLADHGFTRIGGDGGLLTAPEHVDNPVLIPGERADLLVTPEGAPGDSLVVYWVPYDRGWGTTFGRTNEALFTIQLEGPAARQRPLPTIGRSIEALTTDGATPVDIQLTSQETDGPLKLGINGVPFAESEPLHARLGETQVWSVSNTIDFAHPFHLHGFFFQVLEPVRALEWKDTIDVPVGQTTRFVVRYDDRPGMWMFHCHLLDHADAGMMGSIMLMEH